MPFYPASCLRKSFGHQIIKSETSPQFKKNNTNQLNNNNSPTVQSIQLFPTISSLRSKPSVKPKKRVTFSPDTIDHSRENKTYKVRFYICSPEIDENGAEVKLWTKYVIFCFL